jgi:hypothetical protein
MAAPARNTDSEKQELLRHYRELLARTESSTASAARRGMSEATLRKQIRSGQIEALSIGRTLRLWRDEA